MMWYLYTGQQPYVVSGDFFVPNKLFPLFPKAAAAHPQYTSLAERCLRVDPHERPSFVEVADSLEAFFNRVVGPREQRLPPPTPPTAPAPQPPCLPQQHST